MTLSRFVRLARLVVLWAVGLAAAGYVPTLALTGLFGRCVLGREDNLICSTAAGAWTFMLLPLIALPVALAVGTGAALRHDNRGWFVWSACLTATAALAAAYAHVALTW